MEILNDTKTEFRETIERLRIDILSVENDRYKYLMEIYI